MKKQFILVGLLAAGFASAQTDKDYLGKVGINIMTPQATIDIRPNDDNRQETATTNEGILIPKLSKTRVANIKDVLLVEGTLVYVTDDASSRIASYTGTNAKVANITDKGYYYYNGTVWVRAEGIAGKTVLNGTTAPATTIGTVGDFYIDTATNMIYGPKTASGWGTGKSLVGPRGAQGAQGVPGATGAQGPMGPTGPQGPSGVVAATNGVTYDANTKTVSLPAGTSGQVLKWNGSAWAPAADANNTYAGSTSVVLSGNSFQRAALTGDVTAAANSNATTVARIQGRAVANTAPTNGQVLKWNGTAWAPATDSGLTSEVDGIVGNEVLNATANKGLVRAGDGTAASPYTLGLADGTANGQVMKWNATTNTWAPAADANTTYVNSTSNTISGNQIQRAALTGDVTAAANSNATTIAPNAVTSAKIADGQVALADLAANSVDSSKIVDKSIVAADLNQMGATDGQVLKYNAATNSWAPAADANTNTTYTGSTSVALSGNSFQRAALTGDVTAAANSNATVIANNAVTSAKIADGQVALADLAANSVDSSKIVDKSIVAADLNQMGATDGQVLKYNAATNSWAPAADANTNTTYTGSTSVALSGNSFQRAALTGDVTAAANSNATTIAPNAVTSAKIADGQVALADLAANSVDSSKIVDKSIVAADLNQMGATDGQVLKYNAATNSWAPAADANTNTTYTGSTSVALSGNSFQRAALTGDVTAAANSNATTIAPNAVTSAKIADGQVALADLAANSVDSSKIVDKSIVAADLNQMGATNGQVLKWNGTAWAPAADANTNTTYTAGNGIAISGTTISLSTPVRTVAAAYTLAVADNNGYVYVNSTSPITVTVPSALPAGFSCVVVQQGAGQVTIAGSGVTMQTARGTKTRTQYSAVGVIKRTTAEATITGDAIN